MYNVLIADDEQNIRDGLVSIIDWESYGFSVIKTASNGEEALELLKNNRCNLFITDIRMPGLDGFEVIRKISVVNLKMKMLIISGYSDFHYAKKALQHHVQGYLVKPIEQAELIQNILTIKEELDQSYLNLKASYENIKIATNKLVADLVNGRIPFEEACSKLKICGLEFKEGYFNTAIIEIDNFYSILEKNVEDANLIKYSVKNIVDELVHEAGNGTVYECDNGNIGILFNGDQEALNEKNLHCFMKRISMIISGFLNIRVIIGFGITVGNKTQIKLSKQHAETSLERRIMADYTEMIAYDKITNDDESVFDLEWNSKRLLYYMEEIDVEGATEEISKLIDEFIEKQYSQKIIEVVTYGVIFEIMSIPRKLGIIENATCYKTKFSELKNLRLTIKTIKQFLTTICNETCDVLYQSQKGKKTNIVSQIQNYVNAHYMEDLNLQTISKAFYMSPIYLGRVFKNSTGETFANYVNKYRMKEVKSSLITKNCKVSEIIKALGYNNQEYFYRLFKKYEGISFAEYRKKVGR